METFAVERLKCLGVPETDARSIIAHAKTHVLLEVMEGRWEEDACEYPRTLWVGFASGLRAVAAAWVAVYRPDAAYREELVAR